MFANVGIITCVCVRACVWTWVCARVSEGSGQAIIAAAAVVVFQRIVGGVQTTEEASALSDRPKCIILQPVQRASSKYDKLELFITIASVCHQAKRRLAVLTGDSEIYTKLLYLFF